MPVRSAASAFPVGVTPTVVHTPNTSSECLMDGSIEVSGQQVPRQLRAGWWFGTDRFAEGEFFRATIDHVGLS